MRDFSWCYFCATGEINAYLLYKEFENANGNKQFSDDQSDEDGTEFGLK